MPALARGVVFGRGGTFWPGVSWALWLGAGPGACRGHAVAVPPGEPCMERGGRQHRGPLPGPGAQSSALAGLFLLPCPLRLLALGPPSRSVRRLLSGLRQGPSRARLWPVAQPSCTAGQWPWGHPRPLSWPAPPGHSCQPHSQGMCAHSQMAGGGGFGLLTPQWAGGGTGWDAGAGLGDTCRLRSRPAGPAQTCPSPVDTGQAPPRVPGLTDQGGLGAEGSRPAMGAGTVEAWPGWGGRRASWRRCCRPLWCAEWEVKSFWWGSGRGQGFLHSQTLGDTAPAAPHASLLASSPCMSPGRAPGQCPPVLRDVAGR